MRIKNVFVILCICFCFGFSSCELLTDILGGGSQEEAFTKKVIDSSNIKPNTDVYLVKLNTSNELITAKKTGYARSVEEFTTESNINDTDMFIRDLNRQINENIKKITTNGSARSIGNAGSDWAVVGKVKTYTTNDSEQFYSFTRTEVNSITKTTKNISEEITGKCKYVGKHCYIFADTRNNELSEKGINLSNTDYYDLGVKFDSCYELETKINGNPFYTDYNTTCFVPCNEKIIILVSDLFGDAVENQQNGTVGYFYQGDVYNTTYFKNTYGSSLNTNECEMFYIDAAFLYNNQDTVYSTLVHEFNHMINYVIKTVNYKTKTNAWQIPETWYTEMLSMTTEDMFQSYLKIKDENSPKGRLPNFNFNYNYGFKRWDYSESNWDDNQKQLYNSIMYANTYAFGAYLVRNFGGIELLKEMAQNDYVDETSITMALRKCNPNYTYEYKDDVGKKITKKIDFYHVLSTFHKCLFNTSVPTAKQESLTGENKYITLNRGVDMNRTDGLEFTPINLINIPYKYYKDKVWYSDLSSPKIDYQKEQAVDLGSYGFSVHYIGYNIDEFTLYASTNKELEYYLVQLEEE